MKIDATPKAWWIQKFSTLVKCVGWADALETWRLEPNGTAKNEQWSLQEKNIRYICIIICIINAFGNYRDVVPVTLTLYHNNYKFCFQCHIDETFHLSLFRYNLPPWWCFIGCVFVPIIIFDFVLGYSCWLFVKLVVPKQSPKCSFEWPCFWLFTIFCLSFSNQKLKVN